MNPCIVSFFMDNVDMKTVGLQRSVVEKFNRSHVKHYQINVNMEHGVAIDYFMALNGSPVAAFLDDEGKPRVEPKMDHDAVLFLDIDCVPLCDRAIDTYLAYAYNGSIAGNAQRSNHIENGQNVFAAPSATAITKATYDKIGRPSAYPNQRSDVLEEYTFAAKEKGVRLDLAMPLRYDEAPVRYSWEKDTDPFWKLADGMPNYGIGTTYGDKIGDLFYHQFQIFVGDSQSKFWKKCESILTGA
jgi:hypothetical protein